MEQRCFGDNYEGNPKVGLKLLEAVFSREKIKPHQCPIGNYDVIERSSKEEKYLVLAKQRRGGKDIVSVVTKPQETI